MVVEHHGNRHICTEYLPQATEEVQIIGIGRFPGLDQQDHPQRTRLTDQVRKCPLVLLRIQLADNFQPGYRDPEAGSKTAGNFLLTDIDPCPLENRYRLRFTPSAAANRCRGVSRRN